VRERTIGLLGSRYQIDIQQAARVEQTALALLGSVAREWSLADEEARQLLGWAARLHEVGLTIAHNQYHKHGAYLLANCDLLGFSNREQQQLSILVRAHRRKFPQAELMQLGEAEARSGRYLAVLLRLAVLLHRSHSDEPLPPLSLHGREDGLTLRFPEGWLESHPLTQADLEQEIGMLEAVKFKLDIG
jgi:exopolyphosphatase/guanosine-5'-triphosphate,3'-diphosphate pyrophosphatase